MVWTDERVETLKNLWMQGKTASQIAGLLGGVTRNAVIGKAHRLGLSSRPSPIRKPSGAPTASIERAPATEMRAEAASQPAMKPSGELGSKLKARLNPIGGAGVNILALNDRMCKWPIGDPRSADFHFCGGQAHTGLPYCISHAAVAYQIPVKKDDKKNRNF